uniref:Hypothetical conserved protein n=1 Tax=uncultured prokaryote TaxID=198431 RepID=H5S8Z9_9ZZZZ|nr:hypothetical conserved protein [uncultured prokaryote]
MIPKPRGHFATVTLRKGNSLTFSQGRPVRTFDPDVQIQASIQPIPGEELNKLFPGGEITDAVVIYTDEPLQPGKEGVRPEDEIVFDGKTYRVFRVQTWKMGQLDHFKALAIAVR